MRPGVHLRELIELDFEPLLSMMQDPVGNEMSMVYPPSRGDLRSQWDRIMADPACVHRTIELDGVVVGRVNSFPLKDEIHVGYLIDRAYWGRGIMGESLRQFLAVDERRPLIARVAKSNAGSCRVLEKNGFVLIDEYDSPETDRYRACVEVKYELR